MATKLEKDISRESSVTVDDKELVVTLTSNQTIQLKKKGTRKGVSEIPIEDLWEQLNNNTPKAASKAKSGDNSPMISLYDLRHHSAVSGLGPDLTAKFDGVIRSLIREFYPDIKM